jgi:hypothetical protein
MLQFTPLNHQSYLTLCPDDNTLLPSNSQLHKPCCCEAKTDTENPLSRGFSFSTELKIQNFTIIWSIYIFKLDNL